MPNDPRIKALSVLNRLNRGRKTLDNVLEDTLEDKNALSKRDQALFNALVYGVLRWRNRLDWIVAQFSTTPLNKIEPNVLNIMRIGLFQIVFLDRIPVSAAANTSVEMTKAMKAPWVVRYVNALLRKASGGYQSLAFPDVERDPVKALAVIKSFPEWLVKKWIDRLGINETSQLCDAINTIPSITVRTNSIKTTREKLLIALANDAEKIQRTQFAPEGICFSHLRVSIPKIESFQKGWFQVQDEAAQLISCFLNPQPGEKILDACAGLGGKTFHIAQMMKNKGQIVAVDIDIRKLQEIESEKNRLGISIISTCRHDLNEPFHKKEFNEFDRILLDAPCSGLGVLRRNPDTKWRASKRGLQRYKERQLRLLDNLAPRIKPGGIIVFAVCSIEPEENQEVVNAFLNKRSNFAIDTDYEKLSFPSDHLIDQNGFMITFPHRHNMDGFFSTRLKRIK